MTFSFIIAYDKFGEEARNLVNDIYKMMKGDFEVIVVDGSGSTIPVFDKRATVIPCTTTDPFNYNAARNLGSQYANGDFLVFLDATLQPTKSCFHHLKSSAEVPNVLLLGSRIKRTKYGSVSETLVGGDFALCFATDLFKAIGGFDVNASGKQTQEDFEQLKKKVIEKDGRIVVEQGFKFISIVIIPNEKWRRDNIPFDKTDYGVEVNRYRELYDDILNKYQNVLNENREMKQSLEQTHLSESLLMTANQNQVWTIEDLKKRLNEEYLRGQSDAKHQCAIAQTTQEAKCRELLYQINDLKNQLADKELRIVNLTQDLLYRPEEKQLDEEIKPKLLSLIMNFIKFILRKNKNE